MEFTVVVGNNGTGISIYRALKSVSGFPIADNRFVVNKHNSC